MLSPNPDTAAAAEHKIWVLHPKGQNDLVISREGSVRRWLNTPLTHITSVQMNRNTTQQCLEHFVDGVH